MKKKNGKGREQAFLQKKYSQMAKKPMTIWSPSLVIREIQAKITVTQHLMLTRICGLSRFGRVWFFVTPRTARLLAHGILQARILDWVALPSSGDLPNPAIISTCLTSPALAGRFFTTSATWEAHMLTGMARIGNVRSDPKWRCERILNSIPPTNTPNL